MSEFPTPPETNDINVWLVIIVVLVLAVAVLTVARKLGRLIDILAAGGLVPHDVEETIKVQNESIKAMATALNRSSDRETEYMRWIEHRQHLEDMRRH